MKVLFVGIGVNGEKSLRALFKGKFNIVKVIIPKNFDTGAIKKIAKKNSTEIVEVLNRDGLEKEILSTQLDIIAVASSPFIFSKKVVSYPRLGIVNVHGSLLPKYRGYHPIHWAI